MKRDIYHILGAIWMCMAVAMASCSEDCDHLDAGGNDAYILSTSVVSGVGSYEGVIRDDSVFIFIPRNTNVELLRVQLEISEQAKIHPSPDSVTSWENPVGFVVTSSNGRVSKEYVVVVRQVVKGNEFHGSVRLGSQKEVDGFGENDYTKVQDLVLYNGGSNDPIKNLSPLSTLREIPGGLTVMNLGARDIHFENLEKLGMFEMHSIAATKVRFPSLQFVAERFRIGINDPGPVPTGHVNLEQVYLPKLKYVGGAFILYLCEKLKTLKDFSSLEYIGKDVVIQGGRFTTLEGFDYLKQVNGDYLIMGELESLDGFSMEHVVGNCKLYLENVTTLEPLKALKKVGGILALARNRHVKDLKGIESVDVDYLEISGFLALETLDGIPVKPNMQYLNLETLPALRDISALSVVESVDLQLNLSALAVLPSLAGLENLKRAGTCMFNKLPELVDISAVRNLEQAELLQFSEMNVLKQLPEFSTLTEVGSLHLANLVKVENLNGLESLTKITKGGLILVGCPELTDISGLKNITEINFYRQSDKIQIQFNAKLASYCPIMDLLNKYRDEQGRMYIMNNFYNPTKQDVIDRKCEGEGGSGFVS